MSLFSEQTTQVASTQVEFRKASSHPDNIHVFIHPLDDRLRGIQICMGLNEFIPGNQEVSKDHPSDRRSPSHSPPIEYFQCQLDVPGV